MTPRKLRFIEEYARLKNGKQAALAAGYAERCAAPMASKLLRMSDVQEALIAAGVEIAFATYGPKPATRISPFLTPRQERFIEHYLVLGKGAEAARRAGYSPRSAHSIADKLLNTPRVAAAIAEANAARAARLRIDAEHVLAESARLAFADIAMIVDWGPNGVTVKPASALAPEDRAAIAEIVADIGETKTRLRVKLFNKQRALETLAKHLGLFNRNASGADKLLIDGKDPREVLHERLRRIIKGAKSEG